MTNRLTARWNWSQSNQSESYFNSIQHQLFKCCLQNDKVWKNYTGLPLGLGYGCLTVISQITLIGEQVIKGLGNILGCVIPCTDLKFRTGCSQLNQAARNTLYLFIGIPLVGMRALFIIPIMTFLSPDSVIEQFVASATLPVEAKEAYIEPYSFNENDVLTEFVF